MIVLFDAVMGFIGAIVIFAVTGFAAKSAEMSLEEIPASSGKYSLFPKVSAFTLVQLCHHPSSCALYLNLWSGNTNVKPKDLLQKGDKNVTDNSIQ